MRRFAESAYMVMLTAWVGGMWAVGYLVAPVLFSSLGDRRLAGVVAGKLFEYMGWFGLAIAACVLLFLYFRWRLQVVRRSVFWLVLATAALVAVGLFGIQPLMVQMKADAWPRDVMESVLRDRFRTWHGVSSVLYLIQSLLGAWLVIWSGRGLR